VQTNKIEVINIREILGSIKKLCPESLIFWGVGLTKQVMMIMTYKK
jgi:hypothetical protein